MALFPITGDVTVVRIPELPEETALANDDKIPIWHASNNVTSHVSLATLRSFIETGSGGTLDSIYSGGSVLYIVPASAEGLDYFSYPSIAGYSFKLTRDGYPMKIGTEYLVLSAGGFKLLGTTLVEGQRYELDIFELYNGAIPPSTGVSSTSTSFIIGSKTVNTNENVSVNDLNKVLQVRGGSNALTITMPDVNLAAANAFVVIETLINNTKQHRITTTAGQYLYINNEAVTELYIGKGEYVWLYRTGDGWYVIVEKGHFSDLTVPKAVFKAGLNQIALEGQIVNRTDYPRLWKEVQALGASLVVNDTTWLTASVTVGSGLNQRVIPYPYRGCFSPGDGLTTFRLPDFRGMVLRGLINPGGSDTQRQYNHPGGFQLNELILHGHTLPTNIEYQGSDSGGQSGGNHIDDAHPQESTGSYGGSETRMDNIGMIWVINY